MGGFLNLRLKKWLRAMITRSFAIIPTMIVALFFDTEDPTMDILNEALNVLQSIQIPFALIPLITLVSKEQVMGSFVVGPITKVISWIVTVFLMLINGYLILSFYATEVRGALVRSSLCVVLAVYLAFIVYLIMRNTSLYSRLRSAMTKST